MLIAFRSQHPKNGFSAKQNTDSWILIEESLYPANAPMPIFSTESGIEIISNFQQSLKAYSPMILTDFEILPVYLGAVAEYKIVDGYNPIGDVHRFNIHCKSVHGDDAPISFSVKHCEFVGCGV